ncbi:MAG: ABC transporter ATP-binding protein [Lachnospiraceae bacterium]|nr:ABC transporter ATP-binding protein [Lachnospiraceae bacterium]
MSTCIEVRNLTKSFSGRTVVKDLSFEVQKQEVFGLLRHNGAGKSTTIESILGLKKADSGSVKVFGKEPRKNRKEIFERVGVQLQASHYQNSIRVKEICQEISVLYKQPADYRELLHKFKLEQFENAQVNKLSGGERQKLSVVLALIPKPEIVFLDELTTGLDTAARREVWKTLKELKEEGTTIFLTTHYMEEAESLCDRICLIKEGVKVIEGTVEEVIQKSPYDNLEEAYLWHMGEEAVL